MTQLIACLLAASTALGGGAQAAANIGTLAARDVICDADPSGGHAYEWQTVVLSYENNKDSTHTLLLQKKRICKKCHLVREMQDAYTEVEDHTYTFDRITIEKNLLGEQVLMEIDKCICGDEIKFNYNPNN